jgi:VCBS repeat-containing protein
MMTRYLRAFALLCAVSISVIASAATTEFRVLIDSDNSTATGCPVAASPSIVVPGIDHVLIVTVDTAANTVTKVERQQCNGAVLGARITVDPAGWPAGASSDGSKFLIESYLPTSVFGNAMPPLMHLYFVAGTGPLASVITTNANGKPVMFPPVVGKRHSVETGGAPRTIVLDGDDHDWAGVNPLVNGAASFGTSAIKFTDISLFATSSRLFFLFRVKNDTGTGTPPVAVNDAYSVVQGHTLAVVAPGVLANDTDPGGHTLTAAALTQPAGGSLSLSSDGGFTYVNGGSLAPDSFQYKANNGSADSNAATVTISVFPDAPPVAVADAYSVAHGGTLNVAAPGVLANDSDADGDSITALFATPPSHGTLTLNANGSLKYIHDGSNTLTDTFTYRATDGIVPSAPATVTITIGPDAPPVAVADNYTVLEGGTLNIAAPGVLANDTDPDTPFSSLTANQVSGPSHGSLTLNPNGSFIYTNDNLTAAADSFTYRVSDGILNSAPVTVSINVTPVNHAPKFTAGAAIVTVLDTAGAQSTPWATGINAGAADESGQVLNFIVSNDNNALFSVQPSIAPNGTLSFTPIGTAEGIAMVTVRLHDNGGTANGGVDTSAPVTFEIDVDKMPTITSANNVTFKVGVFSSFTVTTDGQPKPSIAEGGALPSGVTFVDGTGPNKGTGVLSGTPAAGTGGTYPITFQATNTHGSSPTQNFTLTVQQAPAITSANNVTFKVGSAGTFTVTTTGFPTNASMSIGETGALPGGVTFVNNNDGTATLAGTPNALTGGTYPITITANNGVTPNATQNFTLTVQQAPAITSANNVTFKVGVAGTFTVTTTGFPTNASMVISESGALPGGVTFVNNNDGTATLAGTPNAATGGTYPIIITANNGVTPNATQNFTLTVQQAPAITSANNVTFKVGSAGTFTVTTTGFPTNATMSIGETGALPGGVTFVNNNDGTATLAGTPNAATGGTYPIIITANNGVTPNATQNFTLTVQQAPAITSANNVTFKVGVAGTFAVTTTGFPTNASMSISETGALPGGVTFVNNNDGTATLAGTPNAATGGTYPIIITANNGVTPNATQNFTLTVQQAPAITSANNVTFKVGSAGTFTVTTTGFPTNASMVIGETGALPGGVTFVNNNDGTATLAGTPAALTGGTYPLTITANNGVTPNATQNFTLTVNEAPQITSANSAVFPPGTPTTFTVTTTGFPTGATMVISETGDPLPGTVTFTDNHDGTATIAGTATGSGDVNIVITAANGVTPNATQNFTLHRDQAPQITSANNTTFKVGVAGTFTVTTTGSPTGPSMLISETGALPGGVTFVNNNDGTATLAGTPNAATGGTYPIVITANNGIAPNATQNFTLTVQQAPAITSANNVTFKVGVAGTFSVTTTGFPTAVALSETGSLPANVTFTDNGNGTATLAGTPAAATGGTYPIIITGNNGVTPNATQNFTLTVQQAPAITSANTTTFQTGQAGTFTVTTTGFPTNVALSKTGSLPLNVTFTDNGNGTATIAGTPNAATGGTYPITITGNNGVTPNATQNFTLVVNQAPAITSVNNATFKVGVAGTFSVTTSGFPTNVALSETGSLPANVTFTDNGNGTATLAGTPAAATGGTYPIIITGNNGVSPNATQNFTLTVNQAPAITSLNTTTFQTGQLGTFTVTTSGFPTNVALSKTGSIPASVTFTDNGNGTATITGTPAATDGGSYPITITGNNGVTPNATQNFTLIINQAPAITSANSASFQVGVAGQTFTVTTTGFPTNGITRTGTLPSGVTFTDNGNNTATIAGTPASGTQNASPYAWVITANNAVSPNATQNFTFNVTCPVITVARNGGGLFPAGTFNTAYNGQSFTASGGTAAYTFAVVSGTFPTGLSLAANGAISGTPTATGTFVFDVKATDASSCTGTATFTIAINPSAGNDSYSNLVNNTEAVVTGGTTASPATPFVSLTGTIIANDLPSGGVVATAGTVSSANGTNNVVIAADGTFKYTPPVTASPLATDSFTYTITSNTGGTATPTQATGTVTLNLANRVWYVKNNGSNGNGQSQSPFNSLSNFTNAARVSPDTASDIIFVYNGDGTTTNQNAGIKLLANEQLIGEGVALVVNANTLKAAGTKPQITNTAGDGVTLNNGNTVKGLNVTGPTGNCIFGTSTAGLTMDTMTIQGAGAASSGLALTTPSGTMTITNTAISNSPFGLTINGGTAAFTMNNTNSITSSAGQRTINFSALGATSVTTIGAGITDNGTGIQVTTSVTGAQVTFSGSQTLNTGANTAVSLTTNNAAVISFTGTMGITTTTGTGFSATGSGTINVTGTANITTGAAAAGLNLNAITVGGSGITFNTVSTTGATTGINLVSFAAAGTVTVNGGTITNGTTGISLQGTNTSLSLAGITITGPTTGITNTSNFGTLTIGSSVSVSAATALNLASGAVTGTFANVSSTGGTNGVNLNAVTGSWGATAGSLTGASGATFNVTGGSGGTITWGPSISQANGANVVTIAGSNSNTINFGGNVTSSGTSTGLSISASSGTYNFNGTNAFSGSGNANGAIDIANGESGTVTFSNATSNTASGAGANFQVDGSVSPVTASITYSGTINNTIGGRLIDVNKLNTAGTLNMTHSPAASGNLTQNSNGGTGISITNSSSTNITISNASLTVQNAGNAVTLSGNTGSTINLNGLATATTAGNKTGILLSGAGTVNVGDGAASSTINQSTGSGLAIDGTTTSFTGTLNLTNATITGNGATAVTVTGGGTGIFGGTGSSITNAGPALVLNGVALTNGAGMSGITSSGGLDGISLTSVTGGTYTIGSGGSLSGNIGAAFLVSGGSATLSYAGSISGGTQSVNISGATGGTISFSGAIGSSRILLNSNTGATIKFTGALTLSTGASPAFTATAGGTVSSTNATSTLTTTTGIALNVANTTIGGLGLTFKSISSNGASSGIVLNTTGAGALTVTGDGASDPNNTTRGNTTAKNGGGTITLGSGGTISGATSSGVSLTSTGTVSLTSMNINSPSGQTVNSGANGITASTVGGLTLDNVLINGFTGNSGLRGTNLSNLQMQHTDIDGNGTTSGTETNNNWNVRLDELAGNCGSTCNWQNSLFFNSRENIVGITQGVSNTTVSTTMTITNCEFRDTTTFANPANDAFGVFAFNNAVTNVTFTGSTSKNVEVGGFQYSLNDNASGTVHVQNNIFENTGSDILLAHGGGSGGNSTVNFDVSGNTTRQLTGNPASTVAIDAFLGGLSGASSLLSGTIKNNTVGNAGVAGSGSHVGDGMDVNGTGNGTITATVGTGPSGPSGTNLIQQIHQGDVFSTQANSGSAKVNLFLHNNSFLSQNGGLGLDGISITGGALTSDTSVACVDMALNTAHGDNNYFGITAQTLSNSPAVGIKLVGYGGAVNDDAAITTFITSVNTSVTPATQFVFHPNGGKIQGGTCGVAFP